MDMLERHTMLRVILNRPSHKKKLATRPNHEAP